MRHRLALAAALCAASLAAACGDDASQAALTRTREAGASSGGAANAFNSNIGNAAARPNKPGAVPLAPPVIHYPPGDDSIDSTDSTAAVASSVSNPS